MWVLPYRVNVVGINNQAFQPLHRHHRCVQKCVQLKVIDYKPMTVDMYRQHRLT